MLSLYKLPTSYIAMDLETTGLDPQEDGIVEIAGVKVIDGEVADTFRTYVDTDAKMSASASRVNGITRSMLRGAPKTPDAVRSFLAFSGDLPMLGHNAKKFDRAFLEHACAVTADAVAPKKWFDTMEIYRDLMGTRMISLADLCKESGVTNAKAHSALGDAQAVHECYQFMRGLIAEETEDARDFPSHADSGPLLGEVVCVTGQHPSLSRHNLMQVICDNGGTPSNNVTKKVTMLVDFGGTETTKVRKAKQYADVTGVRIVSGSDFCTLVGIADAQPAATEEPPARPAPARQTTARPDNRSDASGKLTSVGTGCVVAFAVVVVLLLIVGACSRAMFG